MRMTTRVLTAAATLSLAGGMALAAVPTAMASPVASRRFCEIIVVAHVDTWQKPGGAAVRHNHGQSTRKGDGFAATRVSGKVHGQAWYFGRDARNRHTGWVGSRYLKALPDCFGVNKHRHRH